ncbi:MAG: hypothetical protein HY865_06525 [Chloroflexi bacterium]|nr:hypothetical protein [Chloroflexota bacterium]
MTQLQKPQTQLKPLERKTRPPRKGRVDTGGMLSIVTMLVSLAAVTVAMLGGMKIILDVLGGGLASELGAMPVELGVIGFTFFFGWATGLVSIRGFGNRLYPIVIKIYAWGTLAAAGILYIKVIQKLYVQQYDNLRFGMYLALLIGVLFVLLCLHLLVERHDLRPFAIPLLVISVVHLFVIVYHYVFEGVDEGMGIYALGDFTVFLLMITASGLMLMHGGALAPLREMISGLFARDEEPENAGNGVR